jgi:hypothetical protein
MIEQMFEVVLTICQQLLPKRQRGAAYWHVVNRIG